MGATIRLEHQRITLPDEVMAALKLEDGDALDISIDGNSMRIVRQIEPGTAGLSNTAHSRLERLMRHCGAGRGAYSNAAEADAFIRSTRDEW